jgi:hypothetical protein
MIDYTVTYETHGSWLIPPAKRLTKIKAFLFALLAPIQWMHDLFFTSYLQGITLDVWDSGASYGTGDRVISNDSITVWQYMPKLFSVFDSYKEGDVVYDFTNIYSSLFNGNEANIPGISPIAWKVIGIQNPDPLSTSNTVQWLKILDDFIGTNERVQYTSKVLQLEYILNTRFFPKYATEFLDWNFVDTTDWVRTSPYSDIYITPVNNNFFKIYRTANGNSIFRTVSGLTPIYRTVPPPATISTFSINVPTATLALITEAGVRAIADKYVIAGITYDVTAY